MIAASTAPAVFSEIEALRRAGYPYLFVITTETDRLERELQHLAAAAGVGFSVAEVAQVAQEGDGAREGYVLVKDCRRADFTRGVVRRLADRAAIPVRPSCVVVFRAPQVEWPPELEREIVTLDLPLPDTTELTALFADTLDLHPDLRRVSKDLAVTLIDGARGLTENEARRAWRRALDPGEADPTGALLREKRRLVRTGGDYLEDAGIPDGFEQVGGLDELKTWVLRRKAAFGSEAEAFGLPRPKGVLLLGIQGCGKSLSAKAVASLWRFPLLRLDMGALFAGTEPPESAIRRVVRTARAMAPCVLWIDELEKGFAGLGSDPQMARIFGYFLTWLQEKHEAVFVAATANDIEHLPPELLRKGRFDEIFFVDLPNDDERKAIFTLHLRRRGRDPAGFDLTRLVDASRHFTGAEIEQIVIGGLSRAFAASRELEQDDLDEECRRLVPFYATYEERIKTLRDWAERRARKASADRALLAWFGRRAGE